MKNCFRKVTMKHPMAHRNLLSSRLRDYYALLIRNVYFSTTLMPTITKYVIMFKIVKPKMLIT